MKGIHSEAWDPLLTAPIAAAVTTPATCLGPCFTFNVGVKFYVYFRWTIMFLESTIQSYRNATYNYVDGPLSFRENTKILM